MGVKEILKSLDDKKETLTVKDLKDFISDLPDDMEIYIVSDDEMPVRRLVDMTSDIGHGYYSELYLDTVEA